MNISILIHENSTVVFDYLCNPSNVIEWTCHKSLRKCNDKWYEIRLHGDVLFDIEVHRPSSIIYNWQLGTKVFSVHLSVNQIDENITLVEIAYPSLSSERDRVVEPVMKAELTLLKSILEHSDCPHKEKNLAIILDYHQVIYQRIGL